MEIIFQQVFYCDCVDCSNSPGQKCVGKLDVLNRGLFGVPLRLHRVGSS